MSKIAEIYRKITDSGRAEVFIHVRPQAEVESEHRAALVGDGPLAGLVLAVKDNVDVAGVPTTAACPDFSYIPHADAPAVAALKAAGAVVIGKTNLDQFATGLVGTRSPYGAVRDSRRPDYISGGSSSGSAVAVALGFADIAIGTDTAGSGRVPAGLQGIVGIKPTIGVVSTEGVVPACASYDCVTIFAADLTTAQSAMAVMSTGAPQRQWPADVAFAAPVTPRIAIPEVLAGLDAEWQAAFDAAVRQARDAGFETVPIPMDDFFAAANLLYSGALVAERWDAVGEFISTAKPDAQLDPTVAAIITAAGTHSAADLLRDRRRLEELRRQALAQLVGCHALMVPTAPEHPGLDEVAADPVAVNSRMGRYTNFCNLFDMCAIAIPAGTVSDGAQFGVTLLAPGFHDGVIADLAARLLDAPSTGTWPESGGAPVTELAVFGAHLRGQPLEHQLTERGARWAGPITTAPHYRLYALDTVPPKPGLARVAEGGAPIVGGRWLLSPAALGEFLAELPAPMLLGKVELDDGRWITGFGCDHIAPAQGRDITEYRGWLAAMTTV
ncbi:MULTISPECIES: allophanate hydrolase [unclassified Mycolicibacterium]|uniref:allophanate hydrolase n=1 Tax=unclassified Mycolicibacterium TaxID=2636767 RepID=UPI0012DE41A2|nr:MULTISPECIES: allophanate hydrolase [unclassified Mycolicibacterium]MUL80805.1 allophanate hydrolase [Mycolicibacterium sp. CBMA 329]MUL86572.1 allophanate hydrolase [Mycolicibacterium sp. CBMA 331]MUM01433.1 allophanate hydrolase [Mycolicibacterium sp. CBMA 334]MUM27238.1 allophanate hydrolase [Mycolicibacterium sp. CBMA 295]MUM36868.1 allophanate hydrolase [Mycolicibacterium sp. CBMA 247]